MGSSASKASKAAAKLPSAATSTARKYPTRTPPTSTTATSQTRRPVTAPAPEESLGDTVRIEREGRRQDISAASPLYTDPNSDQNPDPGLASRLRTLGPVQPNPSYSPTSSSTFHSHSQTTSSFADPTLSATQFQPSASNPLQTIFPSNSPPSNHSSTSGSSSSSSGGFSDSNPAVSLLTARYRLAGEAENEFARTGKSAGAEEGRQFLDVLTLRQILVLRDEKGVQAAEIERSLGLKRGVVGRLGRRGVVGVVS